jgi:gluconate:H+ symporter, GntP family
VTVSHVSAVHELLGLVLAIAAVVGLVSGAKLHAFPALLLVALALALYAGLAPAKAVGALSTGFGQTLGGVGPVLGLGAMLGAMVEASGGARRLAGSVVGRFGPAGAPWTVAAVALLVGAPLFFETGVVVLLPLVLAVGSELDRVQPGRSGVVRAAVPALAGLGCMHALVPPHPGPLIALEALHAPFGRTFLIGAGLALPIVALTGPLFGQLAARFAVAAPPLAQVAEVEGVAASPGAGRTLSLLLFPVVLILARAVADLALPGTGVTGALDIVGAPAVALLFAVLVAPRWLRGGAKLGGRGRDGLLAVAGVILVIGGGGAFKEVLVESGIGPALAAVAAGLHAPPLVAGWLMAVMVRLATGSSTVATITAAGALAAAAGAGLHADPALMTLAIGGGSLFLSHVNDAGFWLVRETLGLSLADTFKTWSTLATLISLLTLAAVLVIGAL